MGIISNGALIQEEKDILLEKWKLEEVEGLKQPEKPSMCVFNNSAYALDLLNKHVTKNNKMCLHTDVDVDGIGTTYILKKTLERFGSNHHLLLINKDKVHGIQQKHVEFFNKNKIDLLIITDSSCNEIDKIKQFECDVLVVDHHELLHNDLVGYCNDGMHRYVIVNNTIDNYNQEFDNSWLRKQNDSAFGNLEQYKGTSDMSCGLVIYELLRLYCGCFGDEKLLENLMLFQWVGITLITDVINTLTERNQWYMNKTVFNMDLEPTLRVMMHEINKYRATLDKSYIGYSFAPLINKAIRAGESARALGIVINTPEKIMELAQYDALQKEAIEKAVTIKTKDPVTGVETVGRRVFSSENIMLDTSKLGISPNYSGVIASRLSGDYNKNSAVYIINDKGLCKGSFRGKYKDVDYRKYFDDYSSDIYAQGHPGAFGFELTKEQLTYLMNSLSNIEPTGEVKAWLTLGNMSPDEQGIYHIQSLDWFKRQGYIWRIATGNSKVTSKDEITIRVSARDVKLKETKGKLFIYDVLGMECKAFKALSGDYFDIYTEYTNEINIYIR